MKPRFVKRYAELGRDAVQAVARYAGEVRDGAFPAAEHSYTDKSAGTDGGASAATDPARPAGNDAAPDGGGPAETRPSGYLADLDGAKD